MRNNSFQNHQAKGDKAYHQGVAKTLTYLVWLLFLVNIAAVIYFYPHVPSFKIGSMIRVNGFSIIIATVITFFSGIVHSYALDYMKGFKKYNLFMFLCFGFTLAVIFLVIANNVFLLLIAWLFMGLIMAKLI